MTVRGRERYWRPVCVREGVEERDNTSCCASVLLGFTRGRSDELVDCCDRVVEAMLRDAAVLYKNEFMEAGGEDEGELLFKTPGHEVVEG